MAIGDTFEEWKRAEFDVVEIAKLEIRAGDTLVVKVPVKFFQTVQCFKLFDYLQIFFPGIEILISPKYIGLERITDEITPKKMFELGLISEDEARKRGAIIEASHVHPELDHAASSG